MKSTTLSKLSAAPAYPVLPAENLERARTFYTETLGLPVEPSPGGQFFVRLGKGTSILIYERARTKAEHTAVTFVVDDVKSIVSELRSRGVVFEEYDMPGLKTVDGIATMEDGLGAWFTDSEGNILNIAQM
jgi:catechol 2,3-dioxygenase-like lactoylglutathione lyase family enzyme